MGTVARESKAFRLLLGGPKPGRIEGGPNLNRTVEIGNPLATTETTRGGGGGFFHLHIGAVELSVVYRAEGNVQALPLGSGLRTGACGD